jgi:hypothetical protein
VDSVLKPEGISFMTALKPGGKSFTNDLMFIECNSIILSGDQGQSPLILSGNPFTFGRDVEEQSFSS